ncbi:class I SAM-dependent methyltransferase, partial [Metallibacterium scheffleri]|uniref:class I SAM-dependent methyltransferase n=1 Tax=Metallibacterium scheffleri TaxID=993689 RepID=UPI0026E95432
MSIESPDRVGAGRAAEAGESTTQFGFETVAESDKARRVARVFESVAPRYDLMNDLMSAGLHRLWKAFTVQIAGLRPGMRVLDVASGTGDLARAFAPRVEPGGLVVATDINGPMLEEGRARLLDAGVCVPALQCDAEQLPFADASFDRVSVA